MAAHSTFTKKTRETAFALLVIIVWAAAFGVYMVNKADPSLWGLSTAYTYSLIWWLVAVVLFIIYSAIDLRGG